MIVPPLQESPIPSPLSLMLLRRPQLPRSRQGRIGRANGRAENERGLRGTRGRVESRQRISVFRDLIGRLARNSNVSFSYVGTPAAERPLSVQSRDLRGDAGQRARRADNGHYPPTGRV